MKTFRTVLFWMHLATGVVAGAVVLLMSATGVVLTYEKQMIEWADRRHLPPSAAATGRAQPPEALLAAVMAAEPTAAPTGLTMRAAPEAPATVTFEGGRSVIVDPVTTASLGEPSPRLRAFFRSMTNWHRWLALEGTSRSTGRAITGAANLGFLFVVLSGLYLWVPKAWTRLQFAQVLWFRRGLPGKARDFNWHNVIGIWSALPLAIVVAGAVPISYSWAGNLVYRLVGDTLPTPTPQPAARPGGLGAPGPGQQGGAPRERPVVDLTGLDGAWVAAQSHVSGWRTMSVRFGAAASAPLVVSVDEGYAGQPQLRTTLTIDRRSAFIVKSETFDDLGPGRRARSWLRFAHTGEFYGLPGQTVAGLVSAGGVVLVYTGVALALRRWWAWTRRRANRAEVVRAA